ncbi:hypothetical protein [Ottowia thiooxydans]|uniref:hypothetical protein n=1 Tax=Ottowia thiooxydans TaxID=219182 RepID=UPI00339A8CF6
MSVSQVASQTKVLTEQESAELTEHQKKATDLQRELDFPNAPKKPLTKQDMVEMTEHRNKVMALKREMDFPNAPKKPLTKRDMVEMTEHRNKVMALKREMDFPNAPKKPLTKQDIVEMTEHRNKVMALKRELDFPPKPKPLSKQEVNALIKERNSRPIDHGLSGLSDAAKAQVIEMRERKRERWMAQQNSGPTPASLNRSAPSSPSVSTEEALH